MRATAARGAPGPALTLLLLALASAPAAAQATPWPLKLDVAAHESPVQPLSDLAQVPLTVAAPCDALAGRNLSAPVRLTAPSPPTGVLATVTPSTAYLANGTCEGWRHANATLLLQTTIEAPALTPLNVTLRATSPGFRNATANATVTPGYYSAIDAEAARLEGTVPPGGRFTLPITIENHGNGPTRVALHDATSDDVGLRVRLPGPVTVGAASTGGDDTSATVAVEVLAPAAVGRVNDPAVVTIGVTSHHAGNASLVGMQTRVAVLLTVKGFSLPGPHAAATLAGLAAAALAARRKMRRHTQ